MKTSSAFFHLTVKSSNKKTGAIPVSTTSANTCPESCPFNHQNNGGCYAESGPLLLHWRKVSNGERGTDFGTFCDQIENLPKGQLWRHNQAGDLMGEGDQIDVDMLEKLVNANKGKRGFTYTHKPIENLTNLAAIIYANAFGFTVNLSANNLAHADQLAESALPVCVVTDPDSDKVTYTPAGNKVITCPAISSDKVTCATCQLCADATRDYMIGFPAHGTQKNRAAMVARGESGNEVAA